MSKSIIKTEYMNRLKVSPYKPHTNYKWKKILKWYNFKWNFTVIGEKVEKLRSGKTSPIMIHGDIVFPDMYTDKAQHHFCDIFNNNAYEFLSTVLRYNLHVTYISL